MAQRKPDEQTTFDKVFKLVENLAPEAQERLVEGMKLRWLRRAMDEADESLEQGTAISLEELDDHIAAVRQEIGDRKK